MIVDPPSTISPAWMSATAARAMPSRSTPPCSKKRRSSIAIVALRIHERHVRRASRAARFRSAGIEPSEAPVGRVDERVLADATRAGASRGRTTIRTRAPPRVPPMPAASRERDDRRRRATTAPCRRRRAASCALVATPRAKRARDRAECACVRGGLMAEMLATGVVSSSARAMRAPRPTRQPGRGWNPGMDEAAARERQLAARSSPGSCSSVSLALLGYAAGSATPRRPTTSRTATRRRSRPSSSTGSCSAILLLIARGLPRREVFALRRPASWPRALGLAARRARRDLRRGDRLRPRPLAVRRLGCRRGAGPRSRRVGLEPRRRLRRVLPRRDVRRAGRRGADLPRASASRCSLPYGAVLAIVAHRRALRRCTRAARRPPGPRRSSGSSSAGCACGRTASTRRCSLHAMFNGDRADRVRQRRRLTPLGRLLVVLARGPRPRPRARPRARPRGSRRTPPA